MCHAKTCWLMHTARRTHWCRHCCAAQPGSALTCSCMQCLVLARLQACVHVCVQCMQTCVCVCEQAVWRPCRQWTSALPVNVCAQNHGLEALQITHLLGEGGFAKVFCGLWRGLIVGVKVCYAASRGQGVLGGGQGASRGLGTQATLKSA